MSLRTFCDGNDNLNNFTIKCWFCLNYYNFCTICTENIVNLYRNHFHRINIEFQIYFTVYSVSKTVLMWPSCNKNEWLIYAWDIKVPKVKESFLYACQASDIGYVLYNEFVLCTF